MQSLSTILKSKHDIGIMIVVFNLLLYKRGVVANNLSPHSKYSDEKWKCVPIKLDFCKDFEYNVTIDMSSTYPNPYTKKNSQDESKTELEHFKPLLMKNCSKHLRLLLCSVYLPFCSPAIRKGIPSCRFLCEEVKSKCIKHFKDADIPWPSNLECSRFPRENTEETHCSDGGFTPPKTPVTSTSTPKLPQVVTRKTTIKTPVHTVIKNEDRRSKITSPQTYCRVLYSRNVNNYMFVKKIQACALECMKDGLFTIEEKQTTEKWLSALACICGLLCVVSLLAVVLNYQETCYPERSIVFIAICYLFYSLAYVIRVVYSREGVTCQEENGHRYLLVDGSGNISCAATFLLAYCFRMVQSIWWVILCLTWFLSAGMRWTSDSIKSKSFLFHIFAWGIPCCKTVIVLVWRKIDVNELTGICSVGNRYENLRALRWLVLGPLFIYLIMGTMFLLFGLISLFRLPSHRQDQITSRTKFKQLFLPVGGYAAVHNILSTFILASYFYEYVNKNAWYHDPTSTGPNFTVFLIRILSDFGIGIAASVWLLLVHGPRLYRKMKVKLYRPDLLLPNNSSDRMHTMKNQAGTNETSI